VGDFAMVGRADDGRDCDVATFDGGTALCLPALDGAPD